ncbi:helix-turn-helix transcriptional regulator [Myroides odoratimimus]|uniref:helix-turn-helix domain-containing protein n=1 Tax=Myroides odoratimimus TaxID=76832 RepID=UPI0025751ADF|nr:helix-turn-helix transcriptional regulator [Myroides odoratimimus]MDM1396543.1 helix-turn-helix transcriptional regulator [Myroides odoratimimus]
MNNYSKKIKQIRIDCDLTQSKFAEKLGVTRGVIALIETGKNKPTVDILNKIKDTFNVNLLSSEEYIKEDVLEDKRLTSIDFSLIMTYEDNMRALYFLCNLLKNNKYEFNDKEKKELFFYESIQELLHDIQTNKLKRQENLFYENLEHILRVDIYRVLNRYYHKIEEVLKIDVVYRMDDILNDQRTS